MSSSRTEATNGFARSALTQYWASNEPLLLESGDQLPKYTLAYRTWGRLSTKGDNAVVVCHALTGSADADDWWAALFGPGKALDPSRDFIVCSNVLGGCSGSTGAISGDVAGRRYGKAFPALTIRDQVRAQMRLADALGVRGIELVVGGSMGGLQALEWAALDSARVRSIAVVAASAQQSAWCMSWSETQRMALRADPNFCDGNYSPNVPPMAGLGAARAIAITTYRSPSSLEKRYGRDKADERSVQTWLRRHADNFVARFDANCYLSLIDAMDRHDIGHGRGGVHAALRNIAQPALIVAVSSDALYLPAEQREIAQHLPDSEFVEIHSSHGHDGFLIDAALLEPHLVRFRERGRGQARRERVGDDRAELTEAMVASAMS